MIIAIDLDEVVSETLPAFLKYYALNFGRNFTLEQFHRYHWHEVMGVPAPRLTGILEEFYSSEAYWTIPPVHDAVQVLPQLAKSHDLKIVTSRWGSARERTVEWIDRYFPDLFSSIHFSRNHYLPEQDGPPEEKFEICHQIGATVLIDDALEYAELCVGNSVTPIVFDRPWNRSNKQLLRAKGWNDVVQILGEMPVK